MIEQALINVGSILSGSYNWYFLETLLSGLPPQEAQRGVFECHTLLNTSHRSTEATRVHFDGVHAEFWMLRGPQDYNTYFFEQENELLYLNRWTLAWNGVRFRRDKCGSVYCIRTQNNPDLLSEWIGTIRHGCGRARDLPRWQILDHMCLYKIIKASGTGWIIHGGRVEEVPRNPTLPDPTFSRFCSQSGPLSDTRFHYSLDPWWVARSWWIDANVNFVHGKLAILICGYYRQDDSRVILPILCSRRAIIWYDFSLELKIRCG